MGAQDRRDRDDAEQRAARSGRPRGRDSLTRESTEAPPRKRAATERDPRRYGASDRESTEAEPPARKRAVTERDRAEPVPDPVDESSEESFPASDPPSWTPNTSLGPHGD